MQRCAVMLDLSAGCDVRKSTHGYVTGGSTTRDGAVPIICVRTCQRRCEHRRHEECRVSLYVISRSGEDGLILGLPRVWVGMDRYDEV